MIGMAMSGLGALQSLAPSSVTSRGQKFQQSFQQLGQDLQSGNLAQAQNDLSSARSSLPANPLYSQGFNQIAQDLKLNNLTAAQADYATLKQNLVASHAGLAQTLKTTLSNNPGVQAQQLNQAWSEPHQSAAHRAYTALRGEMAAFSPFASTTDPTSSTSSGANSGLSVTA